MAITQITAASLADNAVTAAKIGADQIGSSELNLGANYAFTGTVTGAGVDGKPAFRAYLNDTTAVAHQTVTIIPCDVETFDSDGCYNTSTYKFTPTVAGTYCVGMGVNINIGDTKSLYGYVLKNGTSYTNAVCTIAAQHATATWGGINVSTLVAMNGSSDWLSAAVYHSHGSSSNLAHNQYTQNIFWGFRIY